MCGKNIYTIIGESEWGRSCVGLLRKYVTRFLNFGGLSQVLK